MMTKENTLVVPIRLEALAVNRSFKGKPVRRWCLDYSQLLQQQNPEPHPFEGDIEAAYFDPPAHWGVYLYWMVPEVLRKGDQKADAEADFPPLPNRWLVARVIQGSSNEAQPVFKSWLIKSDVLDADNEGGSAFAYIKQRRIATKAAGIEGEAEVEVTRLGKSYELESLAELAKIEAEPTGSDVEDPDPQSLKDSRVVSPRSLNALGFGDVNFLAYQPFVNDVFSFHDDLNDIREGDELRVKGLLHYFVAGWYSDPKEDVLHRRDATDIFKMLTDLNWQVTAAAPEAQADAAAGDAIGNLERTIYCGRQYRVDWPNAAHIVDRLQGDGLQIVFGNNALDALLALLEKTDYGGAVNWGTLQFLKPFIYGQLPLLTEPGGFVRLNQEIRKTWFKAKSGGNYWVLEQNSRPEPTDGEAKAAAETLLEELNLRQAEMEQARMKLETLQKLLYDTWWLLNAKKNNPEAGANIRALIEKQIEKLPDSALAKKITQQAEDLEQTADEIKKLCRRLWRELSGISEDANALPDDLSGVQAKLRENHGLTEIAKPPFWKPHDPTVLIAGISPDQEFSSAGPLICMPAGQLLKTGSARSDGSLLPALLNYFVVQHDDFIAQQEQGPYPWQWPWNPLWEQSWNPLFLEWEAEWLALPYQESHRRCWDFAGTDYELVSDQTNTARAVQPGGHILRGRTVLAPLNNELLLDELEKFAARTPPSERQNGEFDDLRKLVENIARTKYFSQSLQDFNNQLQMRSSQLSILPQDKILAELIGEQYQSQPMALPAGLIDHCGIRQGHLKINRLQVYDAFGQCLVLVGPGGLKTAETFAPLKDNNLSPAEHTLNSDGVIELKPRILEYIRLRFDFVDTDEKEDSDDKPKIIDIHPDVHPIVGWVLYNHLDKSLVLFNDRGEHLGELRVVHDKVTKIDLDQNINQAFQHVISQIPTNAQIFNLFLNVIDETLWTIEPNASLQEQHLAVWVGRPLALVRTRLKFEAYGIGQSPSGSVAELGGDIPLPDPENPVYLAQKQQHFQDFDFNIRLGSRGIRQDGLIGYFLDHVFYSVHDLKALPAKYAEFIKPIKEGNLIRLKFSDPLYLTLLVDPRAAVYAQAGIMPYTSLRLPERFVNQALEKIQVNFRCHCLLTSLQPAADPGGRERVSLPLPALRRGTWEWVENRKQKFDIQGVPAAAKIPPKPAFLRDGRLVLLDPFHEAKKADGNKED